MIKENILALALLFLSLGSCNSTPDNTDPVWGSLDFIDLTGQVMETDSLPLPYRITISTEEKLLFVVNRQGNNNGYIWVFDLVSGNFLKSFLRSGAGPGELLHVGHLQILDQELVVFGTLEKKLLIYDLQGIRAEGLPMPKQVITIKANSVRSPYMINNNLIVDTRFNFKEDSIARLNFYNGEGELVSISGGFPDASADLGPVHLTEAYRCFVGVNAGKVVLTNAYTDLMEIYDEQGNLLEVVNGPDNFEPLMKPRESGGGVMIAPTSETRRAYSFVSVGNDEILSFYSGELNSKSQNNKRRFVLFSSSGEPLKSYNLDIPILHFDVDWESRVVYGVTDEYKDGDNELAVITYKLD
ncbi:MAG: 6-bladed beta-propeller [Roseivirga sp.]|nr:6-bladed beta-propeller [Roseivirga sp.]